MNKIKKDLIDIKDSYNLRNEIDEKELDKNLCLFNNTFCLSGAPLKIEKYLDHYLHLLFQVLKGEKVNTPEVSIIYPSNIEISKVQDDYFYRSIRDRMMVYLENYQ
jgi:nucleosome binding factor SPN SPT16 subunit